MRIKEFLGTAASKQIFSEIEKYTAWCLSDYIKELSSTHEPEETFKVKKDVHDSIWGTIALEGYEMLIIDSPVIQRLKGINHLGIAYHLYPQADHSRFAHSLGIVYVADKMARKINDEIYSNQTDQYGHKTTLIELSKTTKVDIVKLIRMAAIFHDVGHLFCSHASEIYYTSETFTRQEEVRNLITEFNKIIPQASVKLSVLFSIMILNSDSVKKMFKEIGTKYSKEIPNNINELERYIEYVSSFILGIPLDSKMLPYCEIISGSIDSDRIDYLKRDSVATNVPLAVDGFRVIQKIRSSNISTSEFDTEVFEENAGESNVRVMSLAYSGTNSLEQMMMSREFMYESVYRHQKVVTAERMLNEAMRILDTQNCKVISQFDLAFRIKDDIIVSNYFSTIVKSIYEDNSLVLDQYSNEHWKPAFKILKNLEMRRLYKRSYSLQQELPESFKLDNKLTDSEYAVKNKKIRDFTRDVFTTPKATSKDEDCDKNIFINQIKEQARIIKDKLDIYKGEETEILLVTHTPISSERIDVFIEMAPFCRKHTEIFQGDNWKDSRGIRKKYFYINCFPESHRYIVNLAVEKVLFNKFGYRFPTENLLYTREDLSYIDKLKCKLIEHDYYYDALELVPNSLFKSEYVKVKPAHWIETVKKVSQYSVNSEKNEEHLINYLKQLLFFKKVKKISVSDFKNLVNDSFEVIRNVKLVRAIDIINYFSDDLDSVLKENSKVHLASIGKIQDGSTHFSYYINNYNHKNSKKLEITHLDEILANPTYDENTDIIIILEDGYWSGTQLLTIFETYLGVDINIRHSKELHVKELSSNDAEKLKKSKVEFWFAYGNKENSEYLVSEMNKIGMINVSVKIRNNMSKELQDSVTTEKIKSLDTLVKVFKEAGLEILKSRKTVDNVPKEGWSEERIDNSALGYNDAQQLIVYEWNVPTYTLTPLWMRGALSQTFTWIPLFERLDK